MKNEKISTSNERIRQLLDELNISQIDFCNKTGIKPSALSNYLNNNRTPRQDALSLIADTYDINPTWLMGYDVPMYYDRSVLMSPTAITRRFEKLRAKLGLEHIRFHDLRHFSASFRSDIGIPKKYIELEGGWEADSKVLSSVYDNPLESSRKKYSQMVNEFIDDKFGDAIRISS